MQEKVPGGELICTLLHFTIVYCALLHCTALYCTILYCRVPHLDSELDKTIKTPGTFFTLVLLVRNPLKFTP